MDVLGNRGKCAQPCRLPYELIKTINTEDNLDNNLQVLDKGHLLSPKDLCTIDILPELLNLGITCFKIEGRLKSPEYVSTVTRIYRKYIDLAQSGEKYVVDEKNRKDLLQVFNRGGFETGYLDSKPNVGGFICKDKPNNTGLFLGRVHNYNKNKGYITLKLEEDISIGDSVSLQNEKGLYNISELMINNQNISCASKGDIVKIGRIKGFISFNDKVFKINSKKLNNLANEYINSENIKIKINCNITVKNNTPISMEIYTTDLEDNIDFTLTSDLIPIEAINSPISKDRILNQIDKLGGTPFSFDKIDISLDDNLYIPSISKLNQLRRDCIVKLEELFLNKIHRISPDISDGMINSDNTDNNCYNSSKKISILLNIIDKNEDYTKLTDIDRIYVPLKYFINGNMNEKICELSMVSDLFIYMPSIMKDSTWNSLHETIDSILLNNKIKGFVISNISQFTLLKDYIDKYEIISNYNMNVFNSNTIKELKTLGIKCVTLSPELDKETINSINSNVKTEVIVYGNLPVMTTNYCPISTSNKCLGNCSSNCLNINNKYFLKDRMNMYFRIIPDSIFKTTTIFNSKKTSVYFNEINSDYIRLDFIDEKVENILEVLKIFKNGNILEGKDFTNGNFNRIV